MKSDKELLQEIRERLEALLTRYPFDQFNIGGNDMVTSDLERLRVAFESFNNSLWLAETETDDIPENLDPATLRDDKRVMIRKGSDKGQEGRVAHSTKQMVHIVYDNGESATYYSNVLDEGEKTDDARVNALHELAVIGGVW